MTLKCVFNVFLLKVYSVNYISIFQNLVVLGNCIKITGKKLLKIHILGPSPYQMNQTKSPKGRIMLSFRIYFLLSSVIVPELRNMA